MTQTTTPKELTAAEVAKLVKRTVVIAAPGAEAREKQVPIETAEVFAWRVADDGAVTVVTTDGQKFTGKVKA